MKHACSILATLACLITLTSPVLAATYTVTNTNDTGGGSLRWAINQANSNVGPDLITFNIPASGGPVTILTTQDYVLSGPGTTIDGYTQPGSLENTNLPPQPLNTQLMVSVSGANDIGGLAVFRIETGDITIRGLNVHSGPVYDVTIGLHTPGCTNNRIQGCFIGTDVTGTIARPSGWKPWNPPYCVGVYLLQQATNNFVGIDLDGFDNAAERNLISGESVNARFAGHGVLIDGLFVGASDNHVVGNLIGTTIDPGDRLPNNYGVTLYRGASDNYIAYNVISGNNMDGIWGGTSMGGVPIPNVGNQIHRNFIGIDPTTDQAVPNGQDGIHLEWGCEDFEAGISDWTYANVVSGNSRHGVWISGDSSANTFIYNIVGLDTSGAFAVPNGGDGIHLESTQGGNFIGSASGGNLISGNTGNGVALVASGFNTLQNNVIGLNMAGDGIQPNELDGIALRCTDVSCSHDNVVLDNQVIGNNGHGVALYEAHTGNTVGANNTIRLNGASGIYSILADDTNSVEGNMIRENWRHGVELTGSSPGIDNNVMLGNIAWGVYCAAYYGADSSPATAASDVLSRPLITNNHIDNNAGGVVSLDTEPANGATLHTDNDIVFNSGNPDVLQLWYGAVEILDSSFNPIASGAYTVTVEDAQGNTQTGDAESGGLWGPSGFDSTDAGTWFTLESYRVDDDGTYNDLNPYTITVTGPTWGMDTYTFDGVDNDAPDLGGRPEGIDTMGQYRYQVGEVVTNLDSDGDLVPNDSDCAPFDPGFQGVGPGSTPCDADSDGYCDDAIIGGVLPSACPNETICTPALCTPTDCLDTNASVNPGAAEGPTGDPTCSDTLDNDCDALTDMNDPNCPACLSDADCSDENPCTQDLCVGGLCQNPLEPDGTACDDGLYCTDPDTCTAGSCGGPPRVCSGDQCNAGSCNELSNVCDMIPIADGTPCDDGEYCTVGEQCTGGVCTGGSALDCSSLDDQCNLGVCNDTTNACEQQPANEGNACDDGLYCTVGENCQSGNCTGGSALDCSSLDDQCNVGACDEASDTCYANPVPKEGDACDDSDACTMNDICSGGTCAGVPLDADSDTYVSDACSGDDCDDGNAAIHPNATEICNDNIDNDCNGLTDANDPGCAAPCAVDSDCDDSNACNGAETCVGGFCVPGTALDCDDSNPCTDDSCDQTDGCLNVDNSNPCNDGDACTMNDTCSGGSCMGDPLDADGDTYVADSCAGGTDCDDNDDAVNPDAMEMCSDGIDNNCNGDVDLDDDECKRPAGGCNCGTQGSTTPAMLLGLMGLLLRRRHRWKCSITPRARDE